MIIFNSKNIENDLNAMLNFLSYLENENENIKMNGIYGVKDAKFFLQKDNSEIKTILKELKKGGYMIINKISKKKQLCHFV